MLEQIENGLIQETKMNTLQAIQFITKSWDEITAVTVAITQRFFPTLTEWRLTLQMIQRLII